MAKQLSITFDGKDYTLEYTRGSIRTMERQGFVADDIERKPMTILPALFAGAFLAHHPTMKADKVDAIYKKLSDKQGLIRALSVMYNETLETLFAEPDEGNVNWTPNWEMKSED